MDNYEKTGKKLILLFNFFLMFLIILFFHIGFYYAGFLFLIGEIIIWLLYIEETTNYISWTFIIFGVLEIFIFYRILFGFFLFILAILVLYGKTGLYRDGL